jgi:hypothetical protein
MNNPSEAQMRKLLEAKASLYLAILGLDNEWLANSAQDMALMELLMKDTQIQEHLGKELNRRTQAVTAVDGGMPMASGSWVVSFEPDERLVRGTILAVKPGRQDDVGDVLVAKKEAGVSSFAVDLDGETGKMRFTILKGTAILTSLTPQDDPVEEKSMAPTRDRMQFLGESMIVYDGDKCFGYLMHFEGRGVFSAELGKVDVTPEEARINNEAYEKAEIEGLDKNCHIGMCGRFYLSNPKGGTPSVRTFLGTVVSSSVQIKGRKITFQRGDMSFMGVKQKDSDLFDFQRIG